MTDPFTTANAHAAGIREHHEAFVRMGFTDDQAFELTRDIQRAALEAELFGSTTPLDGDEE